jgi:hypothetical protein
VPEIEAPIKPEPATRGPWRTLMCTPGVLLSEGASRDVFRGIRGNTASAARSVQSSRRSGFAWRGVPTSWCSTSISAFFDADDRPGSVGRDSTVKANR